MRGLRLDSILDWELSRITPACAGTTTRLNSRLGIKQDHPRLCGDYLVLNFFLSSSIRITPACAGTTDYIIRDLIPCRDHPRLCGDYKEETLAHSVAEGSPPPVRGLPINLKFKCVNFRITPACAGTTLKVEIAKLQTEDHPRLCGDYANCTPLIPDELGSPPPVRGLLVAHVISKCFIGITPACAGTTSCRKKILQTYPDHPRLCGDYFQILLLIRSTQGSPPPVRGLRIIIWEA
ncbi:Domain of uncharacterised function (DUF2825) [Peptoniphilus harei]|nr:Domain of uncharacterised function (DUF2825) [Peptoniphilus harei]